MKALLTTTEAARLLRIERHTVNAHIARGNLKATRDEFGRLHIDEAEIARFAVERRGRGRPRKQRTSNEETGTC